MECILSGCHNKRMSIGNHRYRDVCQKHHREKFKIICPNCSHKFTKKESKKL